MTKKTKKLTKAILETAKDLYEGGILEEEVYRKITLRHIKNENIPNIDQITGEEIRALREEEHLSQAVFARYLNLTVSYISQLERGLKHPTGPTLVLFNAIRRKGFEAILR